MEEYPSCFYINGKKYNKDLTMTSYDTMSIRSTLQSNFDSTCRFRLGLLGMVSEFDSNYNTGVYSYNVGPKSISDDNFTYVVTSTYTNNVMSVKVLDRAGDLVLNNNYTMSLSGSTRQHSFEILGQDDNFIYVSTIFGTTANHNGTNSYFQTITKSQTATPFVSLGATSSLVNSYYSQTIYEDSSKIIVGRDGIGEFQLIVKALNGSSRPSTSRIATFRLENLSFAQCRNLSFGCMSKDNSTTVFSIARREEEGLVSHTVHEREITNEGLVITDRECVLNNGQFIDIFKDQAIKVLVGYRTYVKKINKKDYLIVVSSGIKESHNDNTNSITVFKIEEDGSFTHTGTTVTAIMTGADVISRDGLRIVTSSNFGAHVYKFDLLLEKYVESKSVQLQIASYGFDLQDRLFLTNHDSSVVYVGDIENYTVSSQIILEEDSYIGNDIGGVVRVSAYDDLGRYGKVVAILSLDGEASFLDGTKRQEVETSDTSYVDVPIVAFGSGVVTVNTSVEVVFR